jgi:hypothetical protein
MEQTGEVERAPLVSPTLIGIEPKIMYHLSAGRHTWNSINVERFKGTVSSLHLTFTDTLQRVETQRVQGRVFTIEQVPVLALKHQSGVEYCADFFGLDPFEFSTWKPASIQSLKIGAPVQSILELFYKPGFRNLESKGETEEIISVLAYWSSGSFRNKVSNLGKLAPEALELPAKLKKWTSYSSGKSRLSWKQIEPAREAPTIDVIMNYFRKSDPDVQN